MKHSGLHNDKVFGGNIFRSKINGKFSNNVLKYIYTTPVDWTFGSIVAGEFCA
jgi:hypothetical protein